MSSVQTIEGVTVDVWLSVFRDSMNDTLKGLSHQEPFLYFEKGKENKATIVPPTFPFPYRYCRLLHPQIR